MVDVLILGAGCAGLTAAIYAARAGKTVLVLEQETIGGQITSSPRVENYPGIPEISGLAFSDALYEQALALGAEIELEQVRALLPGSPHRVVTDCGEHEAKAVIVATGAHHRELGLPREAALSGRGLSYCAVCDGAFFRGKDVAVIGGGSAALQSAEFLAGLCKTVHLIHRRAEFRGERALLERVEALPNVTVHRCRKPSALLGETAVEGLQLVTAEDAPAETLAVSGVFVSVGQEPNTACFRDVLTLDETGYIAAGEDCRTNVPGIFTAGDCRTKSVRQLTTAAADGSVAALAACAV